MSTPDKKRSEKILLTESSPPSKELLTDAINEAKAVRANALESARNAVNEAFALNGEIRSSSSDTDAAVKKFLTNETPELLWTSHEGSLLLSALIGVSERGKVTITLGELPGGERQMVSNILEKLSGVSWPMSKRFSVKFDQYKNFEISATNTTTGEEMVFSLGNRVTSIPPNESSRFRNTDVKVEKKGKEILIGDRIKLEQDRIQSLAQTEQASGGQAPRGGFQPRQKVSGRNAYEIRADILEMALDWVKHSNKNNMTEEDVLEIAETFYRFVEHK